MLKLASFHLVATALLVAVAGDAAARGCVGTSHLPCSSRSLRGLKTDDQYGLALMLALSLATVQLGGSDFYDVIQPHQVPPPGVNCLPWADASEAVNRQWATPGKIPRNASNFCAQQGNSSGSAHHTSAYCIDRATGNRTSCISGLGIPEQINVQIASPDSVVVGWVTFEKIAPSKPPTVQLLSSAVPVNVSGVTHVHRTNGAEGPTRVYYMHFVALENLASKARYSYRVKSGSVQARWSDQFSFRAPYSRGETKILLFGDMGVYQWNNMANMLADTVGTDTMDLIIHAGDHCYNEGDADEKRADAYMQAYERVIANTPWMPILGNHEFYEGAKNGRYLDQTWQKWGPIDMPEADTTEVQGSTSATSAMGAFISAGNHHSAATRRSSLGNSVPSHTSRYFSVDFGLTHLVALSLNGYNGVDTCLEECNRAQLAWLKEDLAAVDRTKTPWVIAMSHYPMYMSQEPTTQKQFEASVGEPWLNADRCEFEGHSTNCTGGPEWQARSSSKESVGSARLEIEPLLHSMGVDLYWAGHIHYYQTFDGPLWGGQLLSNGTHNPDGVIHVCSGNGGPPSQSVCNLYNASGKNSKLCINDPYSYTRLTVHNATDLTWQQVSNNDSAVIDEWSVHQDHHGPFPQPQPIPTPFVPIPNGLKWVSVAKATHELDLPPDAVRSGRNHGGNTYICRAPMMGAEANLSGSLSFAQDANGNPGGGHCRVATNIMGWTVSTNFEVLVDDTANVSTFGWASVHTTKTRYDLPKGVIQSGFNDEGPTYICRLARQYAGETNVTGSLSYFYEIKGNPDHPGWCRLSTLENSPDGAPAGMPVSSDFEVMVSPAPVPGPPPPPPSPPSPPLPRGLTWVFVVTCKTPLDLPPHAVESGTNGGGGTYVCRLTAEHSGEAGLVGSVSFSGGPGHCRVASDAGTFVARTDMQILSARTDAFRWVTVANTTNQHDLPGGSVQSGGNAGGATFVCRVPEPEGTPGHLYESGLSGSVSYPGPGDQRLGECRVLSGATAHRITQNFQVMVARMG